MNVNGCRWCVAMAVAALMTVSACRTQPKTTDQQTAATRDDAAISTSIESKFFADSTTKGTAIDVDTDNRVVTLTGNVPNVTVKQRAVEIAKNEEGVTRVEDRLVVATETAQAEPKPEVTPDAPQNPAWISTKIQAKYFMDNDVKGRNIDVSTSSTGQVTLRGSVDSDAMRQKAVNLARSTEGVTGVDDELRVAQPKPADRPTEEATKVAAGAGDGWITAKIQSKYFLDPDVKGRNINVDTSSGVVTLSGHVESPDERRQAVQLAKGTDGVTDVRDQLQVKATPGRAEDTTSKVAKNVNDIWIATKIQSKYFLDDDVKGLNIDVTAKSGVVTLEGKVSSAEEKKAAEALAKDTRGVSRVVNRLVVGTGQN